MKHAEQGLRSLCDKGWSSMGRLANTLQPAAKHSPQAARRIVDALTAFLVSLANLPQDSHDLVELLYQQRFRLGAVVEPGPSPILEKKKGKTKTGRLCEALLALNPDECRAQDANSEALLRRVERAETTL